MKIKTTAGIAKLVGVVACMAGAATLAFYKGPHLKLLSHHVHPLLGYHKSEQHQAGDHAASGTWIKGCFLVLLSNICWGLWLVLQVILLFPPFYDRLLSHIYIYIYPLIN